MSEDTYKGESPGKKVARSIYHSVIAVHMGGPRYEQATHAVLASRNCGDFGPMKALGGQHIVGIERDASAHADALRSFPDYDLRLGDAADVIAGMSPKPSNVFLDLCSPLCTESINLVRSVLGNLRDGSVLGVAMLKGRERDGQPLPINPASNRNERRRRRRAQRIVGCDERPLGELVIGSGDPVTARSLLMNDGLTEIRDLTFRRVIALMCALGPAGARLGKCLVVIDYHSRTSAGAGVPMFMAAWEVGSRAKDRRNQPRTRMRVGDVPNWSIRIDEHEFRNVVLRYLKNPGTSVDGAATFYNVAPTTIAAWKAHETRGTYAATG